MPLVNCPECNNKISTGAEICPHCGKVFKNQRPPHYGRLGCGLIMIIAVLGAAISQTFGG